ncbi:Exosome complex exonuclease RRP42 [Harpegnathos saltator]|uniref:Ribosomal RNA-processing protein 42 n=1 Tax=Harpegnathos saltator TaxID=610380 RepID=E2BIA1_HARSA|nr:Exosome complex exonuclease RRP42 [Harpegnathos saltator]
MAEIPLSLGEKTFILHGIDSTDYQTGFRNDGRQKYEYRSLEIETRLMPQTNGSARLRIGNTDVLVGVKVEIDTPHANKPEEGKLDFFVDCSANATPAFEGKGGEDLATEISNLLSLAYRTPYAFDLKELCILPHKKCWKMYVDILILQCGGNLFDAVGAAVKAALYNTEIPRVVTAMLDGNEPDVKLSDDLYDCIKLNVTNYPVVITVCKIGDNCVVDPTPEEESCSVASLIMSVMPNGKITSVVKIGYASLQPVTLIKMLEVGKSVALRLNQALLKGLQEEDKLGRSRPICGFLR